MTKKYKVTADGKVKISINIPLKTLERLDAIRKTDEKSRSTWITSVIMEKLAQ